MINNPIRKSSRTFEQIMADMNASPDLRSAPEWAKALNAGPVDVGNRYVDAQRDDSYPDTAITRDGQIRNLQGLNYYLSGYKTSSGTQRFNMRTDGTYPKVFQKTALKALRSSDGRQYESRDSVNFSPTNYSMTWDFANQAITVSNVFHTGDLIKFTVTSGSLPTGVDTLTDYYVIYVSNTRIKIAKSAKDAKDGIAVTFLNDFSGVQVIKSYAMKTLVYQQTLVAKTFLGNPTTDKFQEFRIPSSKILKETLVVYLDITSIPVKENLVELDPGIDGCRAIYKNDDTVFLRFGDGTVMGKIPTLPVYAEWATGGGLVSKESMIGAISVYSGADADVVDTSNISEMIGGADVEDYDTAKILARELLAAGNRFDFVEHGEALIKAYANLSTVKVHAMAYGPLSAQVIIVPKGGGSTTQAFKDDIRDYAISKTTLKYMDIRVFDYVERIINVTSAVKAKAGYDFGDVERWYDMGITLYLSDRLDEIQSDLKTNGLESARALINSIYGLSLTYIDDAQIDRYLKNFIPLQIGAEVAYSDISGAMDIFCYGVESLIISAPMFPIVLNMDEMTVPGVITTNVT